MGGLDASIAVTDLIWIQRRMNFIQTGILCWNLIAARIAIQTMFLTILNFLMPTRDFNTAVP